MESQRNILLIGLLFVSFLMWQQWQTDKAPKPATAQTVSQTNAASQHSADVPEADISGEPIELPANKNLISVKTDQLDIKISPI
ncbi:hypothetical protein, partial [Psychrobacter sp. CAL346-MNA-CIBAN-0220]